MSRKIRRARRRETLMTESAVLGLWHDYKTELRTRAIANRAYGINWRYFHTGQASLGLSRDGRLHVLDSANHKPNQHNDDGRQCSEEWPLDWSEETGGIILAMAIASRPQADDFTGVDIKFLLPCGKSCRPRIRFAIEQGRMFSYTRLDLINSRRSNLVLELTMHEMLCIAEPANNGGMIA